MCKKTFAKIDAVCVSYLSMLTQEMFRSSKKQQQAVNMVYLIQRPLSYHIIYRARVNNYAVGTEEMCK